MSRYQETTLKNGLRILTEYHPRSKAVHMSYSVHVGSRDEPADLNGISHLIEHMVFKGTKKRSAYKINEEIELLGGDINAYTSREITCFYSYVLSEDYRQGIDILSDVVFQSKMAPKDLANEKQVVMHEIAMTEDMHEEQIFDDFYEYVYPGESIGRPILGTEKSLESLNRAKITKFIKENYRPDKMLFVSCGGVKHDDVVRTLKKYVNKIETPKEPTTENYQQPSYKPIIKLKKKKSEQSHVLIGVPLSSYKDGVLYEASVLNTYLGSGSISLLFQDLREKKPLCYSVYSMFAPLEDSGMLLVYVGTDKKHLKTAIATILKRLKQIKKKSIPKAAIEDIKKQWIKTLVMQSEDMDGRMNQILQDTFLGRKYRTFTNIEKSLRAVNEKSMRTYIDKYLDIDKPSMLLYSDMKQEEFKELEGLFDG